jgi:DNA replication protein DnaC
MAGDDTGSPKEVIAGNLDRWNSLKWDAHPALLAAKKIIVEWSRTRIQGGGLIIAGKPGCGKTHIAQAIADARGPLATLVNEVEFIKAIQATYGSRDGQTENSISSRYTSAELLIYDDLGAYTSNNLDWLQGLYYNLFNGRKEVGRATIITTNLPLIDHAKNSPLRDRVGYRVFSRLLDQVGEEKYFVDLFSVPDYRLRGFWK